MRNGENTKNQNKEEIQITLQFLFSLMRYKYALQDSFHC